MLLMIIIKHISLKFTQNLTTFKKNKKKYHKDYIGLFLTIIGNTISPLLENKVRGTYELWTDEIKSSTARNYLLIRTTDLRIRG